MDKTTSAKNKNLPFLAHITNEVTQWRCDTFWTKEPETIRWIDTFKSNEVFVDIGANIGLFSLYAAMSRKVKVIAFEPEALNYASLTRNIILNKLYDIKAYPIAISNEHTLGDLQVFNFEEGAAFHSFQTKTNFHNLPCYSQGCLSMTIDELVEKKWIPIPHHIKIDVDGIEDKIIHGAEKVLSSPKLQSVLVELNRSQSSYQEIINIMTAKGFIFSEKQATSSICTKSSSRGMGNVIFCRKQKLLKSLVL